MDYLAIKVKYFTQINVRLNVRMNVRLNDTQKQILKFLKENPKYTALDLSVKLNLTKKTIERNFISLKENNIIQRGGSKRDGYWIVL